MPCTKEDIEDKLRKLLDACYVVRFVISCFPQLKRMFENITLMMRLNCVDQSN